jgi:4-amino-4-deoxy-L-arabinose transferase-like glycosyltransferase
MVALALVEQPTSPGRKVDALALLVISVPLAVERALLIGRTPPTAADETLYLMQALDWLGRFIKISPDVHRTWGVSAILTPLAAATSSVAFYRAVFALIGSALCLVVYRIGRRFTGPIPAGFAALMLGLTSTELLGSVRLLPDAAAALAVAVAYLFYWDRVVQKPPDQRATSLWPVGVALGSILYFNIAFAAFAAVTIAIDFVLFRRREVLGRGALGAAAALALTVAPYFGTILVRFHDPFHTIRIGLTGVGATSPAGEAGYRLYARWFFDSNRFFGPFWGALVLVGIATLAVALARGTPIRRRDAAALALWLALPTLATVFLFHAEARYMLPWLAPFFLALALPLQAAIPAIRRNGRRAGLVVLAAALTGGSAQFAVAQYRPAASLIEKQADDYRFVHAVAERLPRYGAKPPCRLYARFPREFELHTGCKTAYYNNRDQAILLREAPAFENATFYVWFSGLADVPAYQPPFLNEFFGNYTARVFTMRSTGSLGIAYVYRYVPRS